MMMKFAGCFFICNYGRAFINIVPPYQWGIGFKTPKNCLKQPTVLKPMYNYVFSYTHIPMIRFNLQNRHGKR